MLATACLFPICGRIYRLYSTKWVFIIFLVVFEAGSALCGAAPTSIAFILGRAIAGLGSAGIFTGSMIDHTSTRAPSKTPYIHLPFWRE
jgi:MFS family permease